jgi:hypothetical protein
MALTIRQQPTTPNQANGDLLYVVTSDNTNEPQFQYVMEVSDGSDTITIKQQPNPSQKGVFNIGQIARDFVGIDTYFKTQEVSTSTLSGKTISTVLYEETGSSVSSSVGLSSGISGSDLYLTNGVNDYDDWNFPSASYYTSSLSDDDTFYRQSALTTSPLTQSIRDDEYATLSVINGNFDNSPDYKQDIFYFEVKVYDDNDSQLQTFNWYNLTGNGGGPRTASLDAWATDGVYNTQTDGTKLIHFAAGPKNFDDAGNTLNSNWSYYTIESQAQASDRTPYPSMVWLNRRYKKQQGRCGYDGTRFAFLNELGTFDYVNFELADSKTDSITRKNFEQNFIDYSTSTNTISYDTKRRGSKTYSTTYDETRNAESDYLSQEDADWLRQLVESPEVYIQDGTVFRPIVITTANFTYKTNPRSQKLYKLSLGYKVSNQRFGR